MLLLAFCAGLRRGELARLDLGDVDLHAGTITIRQTHARSYDGLDELYVPDELPEAKDHPNVRQVIKERVGEASGAAILDIMIYLEEMWGTIPFRKGSNEATFLGSKLVEVLGSPEQYERWKSMGMAIALTQPGAGSDPSRIRTMACQDEETGEWVVNGEKIFISLAHSCQAIVLFGLARTAEGIVPGIFVVEKGTRGLSISPQLKKLGQRGWDMSCCRFGGHRDRVIQATPASISKSMGLR